MSGLKRAFHTQNYRKFIELINRDEFAKIQAKYSLLENTPKKYLDINEWMRTNAKRVGELRIQQAPPRLRILDIGCGAGYFLFIAQHLGHEVVGTDLRVVGLYNDMIKLLKVPRIIHSVQAFEQMPADMTGYDVIASHMTCFNRREDKSHWRSEEWAYFVDDLKPRLNKNGVIQFHLNRLDDGRTMERDVEDYFRQAGFQIDRSRVLFRSA